MFSTRMRFVVGAVVLLALSSLIAYQSDAPAAGHLADPFSAGWMVADTNGLQLGEGGVFALENDIIILGQDDASLLATAEAFASRAPYIWRPSADKLAAIPLSCPGSQLSGITYLKGKAGINRAFLAGTNSVSQSSLEDVMKTAALASVHELVA